jgi:CrcB protein
VAFFASHPSVAPAWRLLLITGFLGGLTTFSTFSAESVALLQSGALMAAFTHIALHLAGSLIATFLGLVTARLIWS